MHHVTEPYIIVSQETTALHFGDKVEGTIRQVIRVTAHTMDVYM